MPSFSRKKYQTNGNTVGSEVKFSFPYVHPETHMRSNHVTNRDHVIHYAMNQLSITVGMHRFVTRGVYKDSNELKKMHLLNIFESLDPLLESYLFLKKKRDKNAKLIIVAGGNKHCSTIDK